MGGDDYNYMLFSGISLEDMPAYVTLVVKAMATAINVRAYAYTVEKYCTSFHCNNFS